MPKIHIILGNDEYHVSETTRKLVDSLVSPGDRALGLETFDGRAGNVDQAIKVISDAIGSIKTPSFLGGGKTVLVTNINFLGSSKRLGEAASLKPQIENLCEAISDGIPDGHCLILSGTEITPGNKVVKTATKLEKAGIAKVYPFIVDDSPWRAEQRERDAVMFISDEATKLGHKIDPDVATRIVKRAGTNYRLLQSELEKLYIYVGDREPTATDVDEICAPTNEAAIVGLVNAFAARDTAKAVTVLRKLFAAKESEVGIVLQLIAKVNDFLLLQDSLSRGFVKVSGWKNLSVDESRITPEQMEALNSVREQYKVLQAESNGISNTAKDAARFSRVELRKARHLLMEAYEKMVSSSVPASILLENAIVSIL